MFRILIGASLVLAASPAFGQSTPAPDTPATRCFIAGKAFSAGATIKASSTVEICGVDGAWTTTQQTSSGCFFADNFYSTGASAAVAGSKTASEICGPDGTWTTKDGP
jgi:hypothetical protein